MQIFSHPNILHYIGYFMLSGFAQEVTFLPIWQKMRL